MSSKYADVAAFCLFTMAACLAGCTEKGGKAKTRVPSDAPPEVRDIIEKIAKGETPPDPSPVARKWAEEQFAEATTGAPDFALLLESLAARDYDAAHRKLHRELGKAWPKENFAKDIAIVRDRIGEEWSTERTGFMTSLTPQGPVYSAAYKLTGDWRSPFLLELVARAGKDGYEILQWTMTIPKSGEDEGVAAARRKAGEFLECLRDEEYDAALDLMMEQTKTQVNAASLAAVRKAFWTGPGSTLEFKEQAQAKVINGTWYISCVAYPNDKPASYLEIIVCESRTGPKVAAFNLKAKISK